VVFQLVVKQLIVLMMFAELVIELLAIEEQPVDYY